MNQFWQFLVTNWGTISVVSVLVLKWVYNAWTPNVTLPQFIRAFIGEIVQEAPPPPLTVAQHKALADAALPVVTR